MHATIKSFYSGENKAVQTEEFIQKIIISDRGGDKYIDRAVHLTKLCSHYAIEACRAVTLASNKAAGDRGSEEGNVVN